MVASASHVHPPTLLRTFCLTLVLAMMLAMWVEKPGFLSKVRPSIFIAFSFGYGRELRLPLPSSSSSLGISSRLLLAASLFCFSIADARCAFGARRKKLPSVSPGDARKLGDSSLVFPRPFSFRASAKSPLSHQASRWRRPLLGCDIAVTTSSAKKRSQYRIFSGFSVPAFRCDLLLSKSVLRE